jgi:hypothetical protein
MLPCSRSALAVTHCTTPRLSMRRYKPKLTKVKWGARESDQSYHSTNTLCLSRLRLVQCLVPPLWKPGPLKTKALRQRRRKSKSLAQLIFPGKTVRTRKSSVQNKTAKLSRPSARGVRSISRSSNTMLRLLRRSRKPATTRWSVGSISDW